MAGIPSVVECIKLAGMAWTIGRAFTSGRAGAPSEFQEVENELEGLTTSLNLLAETLDDDNGILSRADEKTKTGVQDILNCCGQTLQDLESFVNQYSEIRKVDNGTSQATERRWKRFFVKHWKTIVWTTEGGNIQSLRNMLHIHVESISMTMQALQSSVEKAISKFIANGSASKSLMRLEATVEPMAAKISDIHFLVMSVVGQQRGGGFPHEGSPSNESQATLPTHTALAIEDGDEARRSYQNIFGDTPALDPVQANSSRNNSSVNSSIDETYLNGNSNPDRSVHGEFLSSRITRPLPNTLDPERVTERQQLSQSQRTSVSSRGSRPDSGLSVVDGNGHDKILVQSNGNHSGNQYPSPNYSRGSSVTAEQAGPRRMSSISLPPTPGSPGMLPPPMIRMIPETEAHETFRPEPTDLESVPKATSTQEEHDAFRKELFTNTVTLCDLKATKIEFAQWDEENLEHRMVEAASDSSIYLIRKRDASSAGRPQNKNATERQVDQRIDLSARFLTVSAVTDDEDVIPYTLWGKTERVIIRLESLLRFHDTTFGSKPLETAKTSWVNYYFEDDRASALFQSALMNKSLILSVKTHKTLRLHSGLTGLLTLQEQMCALENLRLWQDPTTGGVFAMIHYSASFRKGYMAFYINSHQDPIRADDDGERFVKIKGLKLPFDSKLSTPPRRHTAADMSKSPKAKAKSEKPKLITGARIEFTNEMDKQLFLDKVREVQ
ncbi:MAG: hypothetical protein M1835_000903, partial [Candelina submexicana]